MQTDTSGNGFDYSTGLPLDMKVKATRGEGVETLKKKVELLSDVIGKMDILISAQNKTISSQEKLINMYESVKL